MSIVDKNELKNIKLPEGTEHLIEKLSPLLALKRLDNIVDLISLISDLIDITDNSTIEKLSNSFEDALVPIWEISTAYNMSKMEILHEERKYNFRTVYSLIKDPDTLKGVFLILRTLQIIGNKK
nr:hypothetical protein [uncultured Moellerella sp.]